MISRRRRVRPLDSVSRRLAWRVARWAFTGPSRDVCGIPVYFFLDASRADEIAAKLTDAVRLLVEVDAPHYRRLLHDGCCIIAFRGSRAHFVRAMSAIVLGPSLIFDESREELAAAIVHEGTHARIDNFVRYSRRNRARIERLCLREEIAFFERLAVAGRARQILAHLGRRRAQYDAPLPTRAQRLETARAQLRMNGVPEWLTILVSAVARLRW
jgi:hypothetical protein